MRSEGNHKTLNFWKSKSPEGGNTVENFIQKSGIVLLAWVLLFSMSACMSFEESEELPGQDDQSYSEPMDNWGYMYHGDIYYNLDEMPPEGVLESYHECNTWYIPAKCKSHADKLYEGFFFFF